MCGQFVELVGLIKFTRPFLALVSKAKAAKLVRNLVDLFLDLEAGTGKEVNMIHCTGKEVTLIVLKFLLYRLYSFVRQFFFQH